MQSSDKERAKKLSDEGMKRAKDFDIKKMVGEYEKTFVECYYNRTYAKAIQIFGF